MLLVLSPAKSLDFETPSITSEFTLPQFIEDSAALVKELKKLSLKDVAELMSISDKLAALNVARFADWTKNFSIENSKQSILAFNGDVYDGLNASTFDKKKLAFAQDHIRILSGLYGVLRPLDLMQPYRLEMGTSFVNKKGKDLYAFWGDKVSLNLKSELETHKNPVLLNLASDEYFKVINPKVLGVEIISPVFQDEKDGKFKIISFYAKRARGLMAKFIVENKIDHPKEIEDFNLDGYQFSSKESKPNSPVFRRKQK